MNALFQWLMFVLLFGAIVATVATGGGVLSPEYWALMSFK